MPAAPLVWMAAGWAAGGLLAIAWRPPPPLAWLAALPALAAASTVALRRRPGPALGLAGAGLALLLAAFHLGPAPADPGQLEGRRCGPARVEAVASTGTGGFRVTVRLRPPAGGAWNGRAETFWRGGETPAPGELWRLCGRLAFPAGPDNPGGPDPRRELATRGVRATLQLDGWPRRQAPATAAGALRARVGRGAEAVRRGAVGVLERSLPPEEAAILASLLLNERSGLGEPLQRAFQLTGLVHLLSVSGLHVGFLVPWLELPWRRLGLGARWLGLAGGLGAYAAVTGGGPPVMRATLTALALRGGSVLLRRPHAPSALALAFLLVTGSRPERVGEVGLQLSFLATAGILGLLPLLRRIGRSRLSAPLRWLAQGLLVSLAAQAAVLPVLADRFGRVGPWGPLLNLAAGPLVALLLPLGLAGLLAAALHPALAAALAPAGLLARLLRLLVEAGSGLPGAERLLPPPGWATLPWYAGLAGAMALAAGRPRAGPLRAAARAATFASGCAALLLWLLPAAPAPPVPEVVFLAVGQGDAALLRMPDGFSLLVDAGPERAPGVAEILRRMRIRRLEAVAVSHADADHAGGLPDLLRSLPVGELWLGDPPAPGDRVLAEAVALARERGIALRHLEEGWVGRRAGLEIRALNPPRSTDLAWEQNDRSLVLELLLDPPAAGRPAAPADRAAPPGLQSSLLFTGDLPAEGEARILRRSGALRGELLKVAHHGAASSTSSPWLETVRPREAVVSVGPNPYGHPAPATLARLLAAGARLWRTDRDGAVVARLGAGGWQLAAMHPGRPAGAGAGAAMP
ncbi:MAG: ComEC/Rec2 family competence protein [Bacillota bacterium]|nr:ComEC/Rec2 family competence protein [Bacillota bacterium]